MAEIIRFPTPEEVNAALDLEIAEKDLATEIPYLEWELEIERFPFVEAD